MTSNKIHLVHTPISKSYLDASTHFAPNLGILSLRTYLMDTLNYKPDDVRFLDGAFIGMDEIKSEIDKDHPYLFGVSDQLVSHKNSLELLRYAKERGAITVIGGHNATQLHREIITNNPFVDFVVKGDGEISLEMILRVANRKQIPNLTFRDSDGDIVSNPMQLFSLDQLPLINYTGIDMTPYFKSLAKTQFDEKNPVTNYQRIYSHKGCGNRLRSSSCIFCGRADLGVRFKEARKYLDELRNLQHSIGADYVFDVGDDILFTKKWIKDVVDLKKREYPDITLPIGCFGRANRINDETAKLLSELGVVEVVIGFESGDLGIMKRLSKSATPETNLRAAKALYSNGIDVCASYVIGLPGETRDTLENTIINAEKISELAHKYLGRLPREIDGNLIEPHPGSPAFNQMKKDNPSFYNGKDIFELEELQSHYFKLFLGLKGENEISQFRQMAIGYSKHLSSLSSYTDIMGFKSGEITQNVKVRYNGRI